MGLLLRLGSKCYYGWDFYYAWVQMFITDGTFITLVPSTVHRARANQMLF